MTVLSKRTVFTSSGGTAGQQAIDNAAITTVYLIGDTHYGGAVPDTDGTGVITDPNDRQVYAINNMYGKTHPLGGYVHRPSAVIQLGDAKHEDFESVNRFANDYTTNGSGRITYPCYVFDGNHDQNDVRSLITARHGSLTWGVKIGPAWFQAMTETYTAPNNTSPPSVAQINGDVSTSVNARPYNEPLFLMCHRALSGGYPGEWARTAVTTITEDLTTSEPFVDVASVAGLSIGQTIQVGVGDEMTIAAINSLTLTVARGPFSTIHTAGETVYRTDALDALEALAKSRRTLAILHGHDHYDHHFVWRTIRTFSPGSVTQFPMNPPYSTTYPESLLVLRIGPNWYDIANYIFGFNVNRVWTPGIWSWAERGTF